MKGNKTLTLIKPTAVKNNCLGKVMTIIGEHGFRVSAMVFTKLSREQAKEFYIVHKDRPFYDELVDYMISGPIVAAILEKENAVEDYRKLIGSTNPKDANAGTIRKECGTSLQMNAVHGSDSDANAIIECDFFFSKKDRY